MDNMNLFTNDEELVELATLPENPTNMEVLDYMMQVLANGLNQIKLAYKGGYLLNKLLNSRGRMTHDIDFSIEQKEDYEKVKKVLQDIGEGFTVRGLCDKYLIKPLVTETSSGGIDIYKEGRKVVGIDVGLHKLSYGIKSYSIDRVLIDGFSPERMLSDKIHAIHSRKRFRRSKDMYDVFCIITTFNIDFRLLKSCLENRGSIEWELSPDRDDIIVQYQHAWDRLELISSVDKSPLLKPELKEVLLLFNRFVFPLAHNTIESAIWDVDTLSWKEE